MKFTPGIAVMAGKGKGAVMAVDEALDSPRARFWRRVNRTDDCWLWTGTPSGSYGRIRVNGVRVQAHRFAYTEIAGRHIPDGLHLDHLCRNRLCVNPDHLEPVTHRENCLRGVSPAAQQARQTECSQGHPLAGDNLHVRRGKRECKTCRRDYGARRRALNRDLINRQKRELYARSKRGD